jgi:hypothetical protein
VSAVLGDETHKKKGGGEEEPDIDEVSRGLCLVVSEESENTQKAAWCDGLDPAGSTYYDYYT